MSCLREHAERLLHFCFHGNQAALKQAIASASDGHIPVEVFTASIDDEFYKFYCSYAPHLACVGVLIEP